MPLCGHCQARGAQMYRGRETGTQVLACSPECAKRCAEKMASVESVRSGFDEPETADARVAFRRHVDMMIAVLNAARLEGFGFIYERGPTQGATASAREQLRRDLWAVYAPAPLARQRLVDLWAEYVDHVARTIVLRRGSGAAALFDNARAALDQKVMEIANEHAQLLAGGDTTRLLEALQQFTADTEAYIETGLSEGPGSQQWYPRIDQARKQSYVLGAELEAIVAKFPRFSVPKGIAPGTFSLPTFGGAK